MTTFIAELKNVGLRLDVFVAEKSNISRSAAQNLITAGQVTVDGKTSAKNYRLRGVESVAVKIPQPMAAEAVPEDISLDIIYEDNYIIIVNKPQGMVVHPANGNPGGTLVNALLHHCGERLSSINGVIRPGIVHRLDKNTAGALIVAKNDSAHQNLSEQLAAHTVVRRYHAVAEGKFREAEGVLDFPLGRSEKDRKKMAVTVKNSRQAVTKYRVIEEYNGYTHLELDLVTGRTHQIRVHLAHIGHPITGDAVYGGKRNPFGLKGQCLYAKHLEFIHPQNGEPMIFDVPPPAFFEQTIRKLQNGG